MPRYIVFNSKTWAVVAKGDNLNVLLSLYHGKNYQIAETKPLGWREEW